MPDDLAMYTGSWALYAVPDLLKSTMVLITVYLLDLLSF